MKEVRTEIGIRADAARVWEVLTDFSSYSEWNPFIRRIEGPVQEGKRLDVHMTLDGRRLYLFHPVVISARALERFSWIGYMGVRGLFDGEHVFLLEAVDRETTRLIHRERFSGMMSFIAGPRFEQRVRGGFEAMNRALKARAEREDRPV